MAGAFSLHELWKLTHLQTSSNVLPPVWGVTKTDPCQSSLEHSAVKLWNVRWRMDRKWSKVSASLQGNHCHHDIITGSCKKKSRNNNYTWNNKRKRPLFWNHPRGTGTLVCQSHPFTCEYEWSKKRLSPQCLLSFTDENGPWPGATGPMLQLSAGNLCQPLPQLPTWSQLEFGTRGRWVSEPKVRQSDQRRRMPAQMLETSQLERPWLQVLIRVEKKRFLNDPQLTRGLVMVLVFYW